jgi:hypothetical protein
LQTFPSRETILLVLTWQKNRIGKCCRGKQLRRGLSQGKKALVWLLCLGVLLGCGRRSPDPFSEENEIHLVRIEPRSHRVFLNQKLVFVFDKPLDPQSVTERTLRIQASDGSYVRGERMVRGNIVEFLPVPPLSPDLADGSFRPGETYSIQIPHFPWPITIHGLRGELLVKVPSKTWKAVDPGNLPEGYPSPLLPNSPPGPFVLLPPPQFVLEGGEPVLRLRFNHSLYPPSVRPEAFRILSRSGLVQDIPIGRTRILPREGPGGFGSIVEISPAWDLEPGLYRLFLFPGIKGVQDDRLQPLKIWEIQTGTGLPKLRDLSQEGAWVDFLVDIKVPPKILHSFETPRFCLGNLDELKGTGWDPEGRLQWGPRGLYTPDLGFPNFQSLGELRVEKRMVLKEGEKILGTDDVLSTDGSPWDFDRILLSPGASLIIHLKKNGPTVIRVAGRVDLRGKVQILSPEGVPQPNLPPQNVLLGDPRPSWPPRAGLLRLFVGGWIRAQGSLVIGTSGQKKTDGDGKDKDKKKTVCLGFVWARGPIEAKEAFFAHLQFWQKPLFASPPQIHPSPLRLKGSWVALSPWFPLLPHSGPGTPKNPLKGILVGIPMERRDLQYLLQLRGSGGNLQDWQSPGGLSGIGDASFIRMAVLWKGGLVTPHSLMPAFGIR